MDEAEGTIVILDKYLQVLDEISYDQADALSIIVLSRGCFP